MVLKVLNKRNRELFQGAEKTNFSHKHPAEYYAILSPSHILIMSAFYYIKTSMKNNKKMQMAQNKCIRFCTKVKNEWM